jgi:GT2 family glycosyltransferase
MAPEGSLPSSGADPASAHPAVLVVGAYIANRPNHIISLVKNFSRSSSYRVVQHWIGLGGIEHDTRVRRVTRTFQMAWVPKFPLINDLLGDVDLKDFEYVVIADDDIVLPSLFLDRFLGAQTALEFRLAQPARTKSSYIDHAIVEQEPGAFARETLWVEVGPLVSIHRSLYDLIIPFDLRSPMGWGYENIWAYELSQRGHKMGIIDAFPVEHSLRPPGAHYSQADAAAACGTLLSGRAHLPVDVCQQVLRRHPSPPVDDGDAGTFASGSHRVSAQELRAILDQHTAAIGRPCWVLDWGSGAGLDWAAHDHVVASAGSQPPGVLPYFGKSVDVVILPSGDPAARSEAMRVARHAVVQHGPDHEFILEGLTPLTDVSGPSVSILIPTYNAAGLIDECLTALLPTLPATSGIEVLIIDDASADDTRDRVYAWSAHDPRVRLVGPSAQRKGFIHTCNRGAVAAKGDILVFLNNDTTPQPEWLQALLRVFAEHPDAGAAGGKLIYPDGRLQEAGGLVFADGSAANFGKGDPDASAPIYDYLREVDYCSAALLATPRKFFFDLGMFDARYTPAYYEDADYCFKVRAAGRRVYYQPESMVVHIEGATSGTDPASGVKRFQQQNRLKFLDEWRDVLRTHPDRPGVFDPVTLRTLATRQHGLARDHQRHALVCSSVLPEFDRESGSRRVLDHIESLQADGWTVTFAARHGAPASRYARLLRRRGVETHCDFGRLAEVLSAARFELALVAFWNVAEEVMPVIRQLSPNTRIIVDSVDLHFVRNERRTQRYPGPGPGLSHNVTADDEASREMIVYGAADAVLTVSSEEAGIIRHLVGDAMPLVARDGEDLQVSTVRWPDRRGLLFLGNFRHPPNVEAVSFLCQKIIPQIEPAVLDRHPVYIVGNDLGDDVRELARAMPNVVMVGWVGSVEPYLSRCRVVMAPLLHGAGTKRKLIQALMTGAPAVATSIAVEGLPVRDGEHLLVRDDERDFARGVAQLATDDALCELLTKRGRAAIERDHSRLAARAELISAIDTVLT